MAYEIIKNSDQATINIDYPDSYNEVNFYTKDRHFGIPIKNRNYPSCYRYNVVIMLAKKLIKEDTEKK